MQSETVLAILDELADMIRDQRARYLRGTVTDRQVFEPISRRAELAHTAYNVKVVRVCATRCGDTDTSQIDTAYNVSVLKVD